MRRALIIGMAVVAGGCSGGDALTPTTDGFGRVEASLTSAQMGPVQLTVEAGGAKFRVKELVVTVSRVTAHSLTAGWVTLAEEDVTVDVLRLGRSAMSLGFGSLPIGKVTQVRLHLKEGGLHYLAGDDGKRLPLALPSGVQSGIKLAGMFDVYGCHLSELDLTFDGRRSVWMSTTAQGDQWTLRPVVKLANVDTLNIGCRVDPGAAPAGTDLPKAPPKSAGEACGAGFACLSGACVDGKCAKGGAEVPCAAAADCASGSCTLGVCERGAALGAGKSCTRATDCLSSACGAGVCERGAQGQPCARPTDCANGFLCPAGTCEAPAD